MSSLWSQFKVLILIGWVIALIRLALDAMAPGISMYVGVYYGMPLVLLYFSIKGTYRALPWKRLALGMILTGVLVWGIPGMISYTAAQFMEWGHGRFEQGRAPELAASTLGKIREGVQIGAIVVIPGSLWLIIWSTLLIWAPTKFGAKSSEEAVVSSDGAGEDSE